MAPLSGRKTLQKLSSSGSIEQDLTLQYRARDRTIGLLQADRDGFRQKVAIYRRGKFRLRHDVPDLARQLVLAADERHRFSRGEAPKL